MSESKLQKGIDNPAAEGEANEGETTSPWSQLARMARRLHSEGVSRGERAQLRRMQRDDVPPEIYWRLTERLTWPYGGNGDRFDRFWMAVLPLMTRNPHARRSRPGRVLSSAGAKPARVERWLRRDRTSAWAEAGRVLSIAKGAPLDWGKLGYLLYAWDDPKVKRRFARDYFRAARRRGSTTNTNEDGDS